jgi:hypothetical protein
MTTNPFDMEENTTPYWHVLLRHFENKGYIHNGLTIPFLIGVREILEPHENLLTINELVNSINTLGGTILECPNLGEFVIGTVDSETLMYKSAYPKILNNIIVTDYSLNMVNNLDELTSHFEKRYLDKLPNKEYSKNYGTWGYFTEIELTRINELK